MSFMSSNKGEPHYLNMWLQYDLHMPMLMHWFLNIKFCSENYKNLHLSTMFTSVEKLHFLNCQNKLRKIQPSFNNLKKDNFIISYWMLLIEIKRYCLTFLQFMCIYKVCLTFTLIHVFIQSTTTMWGKPFLPNLGPDRMSEIVPLLSDLIWICISDGAFIGV